ncbi:MAG TPA: BTAD domain-containing putative transcriptional regulator [Gaiellaceae bacterium]|nr:BTAD domain-containing putative transcriptional regulator [Gaiellaceae bacterium]
MVELSSATLTLLFSDLEESTDLLSRLGATRYAELLAAHRALMVEAVRSHGGTEVDTQGDSFFCVFRTAREAVTAAAAIQRTHVAHDFPEGSAVCVRIGLHTGEPVRAGDKYVGLAVHRAARIMAAAHGGQILMSWQTAELIADEVPAGVTVVDLGEFRLKGLERPEQLHQVVVEGLKVQFPPPRGPGMTAQSASELEVRILGPLEIRAGGRLLTYAGEKRGALLALLLLNVNRVVSIDQLIDELWGDEPPGSGAKAVQVRVSQLRKSFAEAGIDELVVTRPPGYVIELESDQVDLGRFERLVAESDTAAATSDSARAAELLREALALWRGPPLAEFASVPFARAARARLEELRLGAVERRVEADLALGRHADLVGELETLVSQQPFRERLRAQLMLALYRSGRQADALESYRAARSVLMDELGLEPSQSLQDLEREILQHDPKLAPAHATDSMVAPAIWETPAPERSILVAPGEPRRIDCLLAVAEPLTKRPRRELILSALVETGVELTTATTELEAVRATLGERGVPARIAAFTSDDRGSDLVRLASEQDVDLLVVEAPDTLLAEGVPPADLAHIWREALCDVAVVVAGGESPSAVDRPILVPFGGAEHDWAAVEIGAWIASAHGVGLQLLGSSAEPERGKRDASRSLAVVSLVVQRAAGISAKPLLVAPGEELQHAAGRAGVLVVGLSERWSEEGLGAARLELARDAGVPTLLVRKGLRPGGLTPPERMTRYTWSFVHAGSSEDDS